MDIPRDIHTSDMHTDGRNSTCLQRIRNLVSGHKPNVGIIRLWIEYQTFQVIYQTIY